MPRRKRIAAGGVVFHVINRAIGRMKLFRSDSDYTTFETLLLEKASALGMRVCAYCIMPNHWHLVLWPWQDNDLPRFMHRLTLSHAIRWRQATETVGQGHLYQNRYKSFPVQTNEHYWTVVRYVERNPLRARLVDRAEDWPFSSLMKRSDMNRSLSDGPLTTPKNWIEHVNRALTGSELAAISQSVRRGAPFGTASWREEAARVLELESCSRSRGRPPEQSTEDD